MVSLALELVSRNLRRTPSNSSTLERQEYARRDRNLFWYLLRGSIWESWTRYDAITHLDYSMNPYFAFIGRSWNRSLIAVPNGLY